MIPSGLDLCSAVVLLTQYIRVFVCVKTVDCAEAKHHLYPRGQSVGCHSAQLHWWRKAIRSRPVPRIPQTEVMLTFDGEALAYATEDRICKLKASMERTSNSKFRFGQAVKYKWCGQCVVKVRSRPVVEPSERSICKVSQSVSLTMLHMRNAESMHEDLYSCPLCALD